VMLQYGKYKGWDIEEVPDDYVEYMITAKRKDLEIWEGEWQRRELAREAQMPLIMKMAKTGYRAMALQCHPDRGGSEAQMKDLNAAWAQMEETLRAMENGGLP
jgi:hypothetical protein